MSGTGKSIEGSRRIGGLDTFPNNTHTVDGDQSVVLEQNGEPIELTDGDEITILRSTEGHIRVITINSGDQIHAVVGYLQIIRIRRTVGYAADILGSHPQTGAES